MFGEIMLLSKAHIEISHFPLFGRGFTIYDIHRQYGKEAKEAKFAISLGRTKAKRLSASGGFAP